jgi:predicted outer membrane repeat protein
MECLVFLFFNSAPFFSDGGAIFIHPGVNVSLSKVVFRNSSAFGNGGAIFNMGGSLSLSNVSFYGSVSINGSGADIGVNQTGSLLWNGGSSVGLGGNKNQSWYGGSMWLKDASTATVSNTQFMGQRVKGFTKEGDGWGGGVLYSEGNNAVISFTNVNTTDTLSYSVGGIVNLVRKMCYNKINLLIMFYYFEAWRHLYFQSMPLQQFNRITSK